MECFGWTDNAPLVVGTNHILVPGTWYLDITHCVSEVSYCIPVPGKGFSLVLLPACRSHVDGKTDTRTYGAITGLAFVIFSPGLAVGFCGL